MFDLYRKIDNFIGEYRNMIIIFSGIYGKFKKKGQHRHIVNSWPGLIFSFQVFVNGLEFEIDPT